MRKKTLTILLVLGLLGVICAAEQLLVTLLTQKALSSVKEITQLIRTDELEEARKKTHSLDEEWDEHAKRLEILVDCNLIRECQVILLENLF